MSTASAILEKRLSAILIAGIRTRGKYSDCGKLFGKICRSAGNAAGGPPMLLHYDMEYKPADADFEACVPLKHAKPVAGAQMHELPGGQCITLIHKGPYEELGRSYRQLLNYAQSNGFRVVAPAREIYIKGPGMIFRGNPQNYITEIQMVVERSAAL